MFNPSRDEARRFFFDTWRKHQANDTLTDLERMTLAIILLHPEYHPVLDAPARYLEREWLPEDGQTNPFLHLAMHLSIEEQLSIDQPPGIRARIDALSLQHQDRHPALHDAMDGLAEMIWHAQRYQTPPDPQGRNLQRGRQQCTRARPALCPRPRCQSQCRHSPRH